MIAPANDAAPRVRLAPRYALGALLGFAALNAFGGGVYGLSGAKAVPPEWLAGTPFATYFVPSLILFTVVGGSSLLASIAVLSSWPRARPLAFGAAAIMLGWIVVQVALIGYVSPLQPFIACLSLAIAALAQRLDAR